MQMKTLWMDFFFGGTHNAVYGAMPVHQTGRSNRLAFLPSEQEMV
jgi:hypothetical protein